MKIQSFQIKGKGRGKTIGVPTINLKIPANLSLEEGIYAAFVEIENKTYKGAIHYGPIPVFKETEKSLEIYLLDATEINPPQQTPIILDFIKKIRDIQNFENPEEMVKQIEKDVLEISNLLK